MKRLQLAFALIGGGLLIGLGLYWCSLGYTVSGFIAMAAAAGWVNGFYPDNAVGFEPIE